MDLPVKLRGPVSLLMMIGVLAVALALLAPAASVAAGAEAREQRRAVRLEEAAARRAARAEQREARRAARHGDATPSDGEPRSHGSDRGCSITLRSSSKRILAGETVTLSGSVTCPASTSAAPAVRQITIYERRGGTGTGTGAASAAAKAVTPAADGSFSVTSAPLEANTVFQAREGSHRARVAVQVAPAVTLAIAPPASAASSSHGHRAAKSAFTGTVSPASPGALVALQVSFAASGGRWKSVAWSHVAADGSYAVAHALRTPGLTSVRTIVHAGRHHALAISEALSLEVPQPQNPQLTIASSADPLVFGQYVTLSGLAAAGSGEPVKLLARTAGGAFALVAETTTDEAGSYSFTASPAQSTVYRVTDAAAASSSLFESVAFALTSDPPPATAMAGEALTFSGAIAPATDGQRVYLERQSATGFHRIATGTVVTAPGFDVEHAFSSPGTYTLRLRVPGGATHESSASAPFSVTVEA